MSKLFERKGPHIVMDRRDPHAFDGKCELCGAEEELRPYGPKGEKVCFKCGMKNPEAAARQFKKHMREA